MRSLFETVSGGDDALEVELLMVPGINYSLAHNGVEVLRHLGIGNAGEAPLTDLSITIDLASHAGTLAGPWQQEVARLDPGDEIGWSEFEGFVPDPATLAAADEAFPATLSIRIDRPWAQSLLITRRAQVLAHNEWVAAPAILDSIAAFTQPNTAAVNRILSDAGKVLVEVTGDSSLSGYQGGPKRATEIAAAIYEAFRRQEITYLTGAGGFEGTGQKVLTTRAVLETKFGNCIDLAVAYAACIERAGLNPLIWITDGHAFPGFHRDDERLPEVVSLEPNMMINLVESGRAIPIEMTGVGPGTAGKSFPEAVTAALAHFHRDTETLLGSVDIGLAHRSGIKPFPSDDGVEVEAAGEEVEAPARAAASLALPEGFSETVFSDDRESERVYQDEDHSPDRVKKWKKSLLDLSLRNPLLNLPSRGKGLDLHLPAGALAMLDDLIHDHKPLTLVAGDELSHLQALQGVRTAADIDPEVITRELEGERRLYGKFSANSYKRTLRTLQRDARTVEQETGSNYLYLTLGALIHRNSSGRDARAPLFLVPVRIEGGTGRSKYVLVADGDEIASPNDCLIEWLRVRHGIQIPELESPPLDEAGIDIEATLPQIKRSLVKHQLNYRVDEVATLRLLQFSTFQMWKDLDDNWERFLENPVVEHLVHRPGVQFDGGAGGGEGKSGSLVEAEMQLPIVADGSQMEAIDAAERGRSFVLEGPPGTGKSQTITNLIARVISSGKTVIFVAEKQAALDVVKRRIEKIGLGPYVLDLHGTKRSMPSIRRQLIESIEAEGAADPAGLQAIEMSFRTAIGDLAEHPEKVHSTNAAGFSAWRAYEELLAHDGPSLEIPSELMTQSAEARDELKLTFEGLGSKLRQARIRPEFPWPIADLRTVEGLDPAQFEEAASDLERSRTEAASLPPNWLQFIGDLAHPEQLGAVAEYAEVVSSAQVDIDLGGIADVDGNTWRPSCDTALGELAEFRDRNAETVGRLMPRAFTEAPLGEWAADANEAERGLFGKSRRRQSLRDAILPFTRPGTELEAEQAPALARAAAAVVDEAENVGRLVARALPLALPEEWSPLREDSEQVLREVITSAERLIAARAELGALWDVLVSLPRPDAETAALLRGLSAAWTAWLEVVGATEESVARWSGDASWYERWSRDGPTWLQEVRTEGLLPLHMWSELQLSLDVLRRAGMGEAVESILGGDLDPLSLHTAFLRGLADTALNERLNASGLRHFEGLARGETVGRYTESGERLREALPRRLASDLHRLRSEKIRDESRKGALKKELDRKRGGLSFRELFNEYATEILAYTPCLLMSPSSVANFIAPGSTLFDLVVFDEASQIRVPQAIGAMGRSRSVIVVGDSKQMPPTSIAEVTRPEADPSEKSTVPEDMDSILSECVESGLDQIWLSWHYRSRDESLIAFSNHHYYDEKLSTLPSPGAIPGAGVTWRRVDGTFLGGGRDAERINEVEAEAIVSEVESRLADPRTAGQSIGVVTFNIQQRDLILDRFEESSSELIHEALKREDSEELFVKNLENVQGDERDVILFSLAFSIDPESGNLPLNFGPLSNQGGERRLNVAITRARLLVVLFSSFDPKDIELSRTNALGTHHLRSYLEMAAHGSDRLPQQTRSSTAPKSHYIDEIVEALEGRGLEVTVGVGLSKFKVDLAARRPERENWEVAILLDGPEWADRATVADRDAAPALLTEIMNWPVQLHVYLPDWVRDRDAVIERVLEEIEQADERRVAREEEAAALTAAAEEYGTVSGTGGVGEGIQAAADARVETDEETPEADIPHRDGLVDGGVDEARPGAFPEEPAVAVPEEHAGVAGIGSPIIDSPEPPTLTDEPGRPFDPFVPFEAGSAGDIDLLPASRRVKESVRQILHTITEAEGPIELQRLVRLALNCFDFQRAPKKRQKVIADLVPAERCRTSTLGTFVWPDTVDPAEWRGFRTTQTSTDRRFEEIPPEEILNAALHILAANPRGLSTADLSREALSALGYSRLTSGISSRLEQTFQAGSHSGRLLPLDRDGYRQGA